MNAPTAPVVLVFAGLDPTGGAGLQADIEAIASMGGHAAPVATCLTVQNTSDVLDVIPVDPSLIIHQARAVLEDLPVSAVKLGLLPDIGIIEAIHSILMDYPGLPVVMDPVLASGSGSELVDQEIIDALNSLLLPMTTIITPNSLEARKLARGSDTLNACAMSLLEEGCNYVLITGAHEKSPQVVNTLYGNHRKLEDYRWDRLTGSYHGSGCTLASAIAGLIAQGRDVFNAIHPAQRYTWLSLKRGGHMGMGQKMPQRFYWAGSVDDA